jgi:hypothetical protein
MNLFLKNKVNLTSQGAWKECIQNEFENYASSYYYAMKVNKIQDKMFFEILLHETLNKGGVLLPIKCIRISNKNTFRSVNLFNSKLPE